MFWRTLAACFFRMTSDELAGFRGACACRLRCLCVPLVWPQLAHAARGAAKDGQGASLLVESWACFFRLAYREGLSEQSFASHKLSHIPILEQAKGSPSACGFQRIDGPCVKPNTGNHLSEGFEREANKKLPQMADLRRNPECLFLESTFCPPQLLNAVSAGFCIFLANFPCASACIHQRHLCGN